MENHAPGGALTGGRWLDIAPERVAGWLSAFSAGHGGAEVVQVGSAIRYMAADGAIAECHIPFPPLDLGGEAAPQTPAPPDVPEAAPRDNPTPPAPFRLTAAQDGPRTGGDMAVLDPAEVAERIAAHAAADRTVGVLLVRLGGYAAGIFSGTPPRLAASKTGSRLVHGRSAAGGTSQQRFARRREKQAREALAEAADAAARVFGGFGTRIDAVVAGGDRLAIGHLRQDQRLRPYFDLAVERFLTVPEPRLAVLRDTPRMFRAIRIRLVEPAGT